MDDATLMQRFEARAIPLTEWHHREHIRVAWNYLRAHPFPEALRRMRTGVQQLNDANGIVDQLLMGYHETVTEAWLRLLHDAMRRAGAEASSDAFLAAQPHLGQKTLLRCFYTRETICSPEAKARFVQGDVVPLPEP